jgi:CBS domain-containing protein
MTGRDGTGLAAGLAVLALGVLLLLLFEALGRGEGIGDLAFTALLVAPFLAWAGVSGRLQGLTAPGGWGATFRAVAGARIEPRPTTADARAEAEPLEIVAKSGLRALQARRAALRPGDRVAVTFELGRQGHYSPRGIYHYLNALLAQEPGLTAVFVDGDGRFLAAASGARLRDALADPDASDLSREVVAAIETPAPDGLDRLSRLVSLVRAALGPEATNAEALRRLLAEDADALIVTGPDGRPQGIVRRDDILSRMMAGLADGRR